MRTKNTILIIDPQFDFCNPEGTLFVDGSEDDMARLSLWIYNNKEYLDHIIVTVDDHPLNHIAHPNFWKNEFGEHPQAYKQITASDLRLGHWIPLNNYDISLKYLEELESQNEFRHTIWPEHCISGSRGAAIDSTLMNSIIDWCRLGKTHQILSKGMFPYSEPFGIFINQVVFQEVPETHLKTDLINQLNEYENIYLAGEARTHCVATSLKQLIIYKPEILSKIIVLEDCMSNVPGLGHLADSIFQTAASLGVKFSKIKDVVLD